MHAGIAMVAPHDRNGNDQYTSLLLHGDNAGTAVITDSSLRSKGTGNNNGTPITQYASTDNLTPGKSAIWFSGSPPAYTLFNNHTDFDFGAGDFTVDWWEYRATEAANSAILTRNFGPQVYQPFLIGYSTGALQLQFYASSNNASWNVVSALAMGSVNFSAWNHFAICRRGTEFYTFKNGVPVSSASSAIALPAGSSGLAVGIWYFDAVTAYYYHGYINELRVSKGIARWKPYESFTPPKRPYG